MEVVYSVDVMVDGIKVGDGIINIVDEYSDGVEQIITRTISGQVVMDSIIGSIVGSYNDYITYNNGGTRSLDINIYMNMDSILLGSTTLTHNDRYGAVVKLLPGQEVIMLLPLLLLLLIVLSILIKLENSEEY